MKKVTAIFDLGKTNKKFFLLDKTLKIIDSESIEMPEIMDQDGYPCDDIHAIVKWVISTFDKAFEREDIFITSLNFSTYGASFVHIDHTGKVLTPLYNYTKPIEDEIQQKFYNTYGTKEELARSTASSPLGMLNSGLQLYWLKNKHAEVYNEIAYSLHFPQYLSYLFTGVSLSEFTSIGCHTALWNFDIKDYHSWVYEEGIDKKMAPIVASDTVLRISYKGRKLKVGVGIHDSSSALLPYSKTQQNTFVLLSTGTWNIALNPFNKQALSFEELNKDCLNFMQPSGKTVRASRLFMGREYQFQLNRLMNIFSPDAEDYFFDEELFQRLDKEKEKYFTFEYLPNEDTQKVNKTVLLANFKTAYHQLMIELVDLQIKALQLAIGKNRPKKLFIDGGFVANDIFIKILAFRLPQMKIRTAESAIGSTIGAALLLSKKTMSSKFLKKKYNLKKH